MRNWKEYSVATAGVLFSVGGVIFHQRIRDAVLLAGERCVTVLIPSLYVFCIAAGFIVRTGSLRLLTKPFSPFLRHLGIEPELAAALVFSQFGGYPAGAQLLAAMHSRIEKHDLQRLQCVMIGCGPGFLLGTVCTGLPVRWMLWMMLSASLPNLLAGILFLRGVRLLQVSDYQHEPLAVSITESVENASKAMLRICGMVLAFAALMPMFGSVPPVLQCIFEISCLPDYLRQGCTLPMAAALLCFGGICVHLQIAALTGQRLPWYFLLIRGAAGFAAYLLCAVGMLLMPPADAPVSLLTERAGAVQMNPVPGICLAFMAILLLRKRRAS